MPAGSVLFSEDEDRELRSAGRAAGLCFECLRGGDRLDRERGERAFLERNLSTLGTA